MSSEAPELPKSKRARVMYVAMLMALVLYGLGIGVARSFIDIPEVEVDVQRVRYISGGFVIVALVVALIIRSRIVSRRSGEDLDQFWERELRKAVVLWSVAESAGLAGLIMWFMSGDVFSYVLMFGAGLGVLLMTPPSRIEA